MKFRIAAAAALLLAGMVYHPAWAEEVPGEDAPRPAQKLTKEQQARMARRAKEIEAQRKAKAKIKLVNINRASVAELKTLPGVTDKEALQIIGGRPYGSKAWLQTRGVIDPLIYQGIKGLVVAGDPSKEDAAKMPEVFGKAK